MKMILDHASDPQFRLVAADPAPSYLPPLTEPLRPNDEVTTEISIRESTDRLRNLPRSYFTPLRLP